MLLIGLILIGAGILMLANARSRLIGIAAIVLGVLAGISTGFTQINTGYVGVTSLFGAVDSEPLRQGLHLINPLKSVTQMSIQTETVTMHSGDEGNAAQSSSIEAISSDGMAMQIDTTVNFRLVPEDAPWILQNLGENYVDKIIVPAQRTAVREAFSEFAAQDAYSTRRAELSAKMEEKLQQHVRSLLDEYKFAGRGVVIQQVLLRKMVLPEAVLQAINAKLAAEQNAQAMQYVLQKETQEAERKRIEARGIADFQKIVTEGISDKLLSWKGIEATLDIAKSQNSKIVIIGNSKNGGLPLIFNASEAAPSAP